MSQLKRLNFSIALLQEMHLDDKEHKKLRTEWVGQVFSTSCDKGKRGVAILCHRSLGFSLEEIHADKKGRHVMMVMRVRLYMLRLPF